MELLLVTFLYEKFTSSDTLSEKAMGLFYSLFTSIIIYILIKLDRLCFELFIKNNEKKLINLNKGLEKLFEERKLETDYEKTKKLLEEYEIFKNKNITKVDTKRRILSRQLDRSIGSVGGTLSNYKTGESTYIEQYWFDPVQIPSDKIVDSTGAGDAFRAGLIYSLIYKNQALNNSLHFASTSGGLNCLSYGGNRTPTSKEMLELINSKQ
ncbi:hypothetical protein DICPUDRAFT_157156 [Dictyostelium purpureum]|uniref:Carbohydrate kinase PfkB domain-containing protein n=1 Tax=Dictyostelium purpureum TaxID=5786 RepID=F0ZYE5_DICPU|nr:uncharacterized protein DICPUDRAFT_157156 [Dictyostelium purpureum]EGC31028.1 hypothetical protein DICPUDRAFT_157156 [Dictyostelium purpureum]|eukprot:XP_003292439.1 hypothetical protein DICPUDRAFT_157156 [Dictyostelium purpureum]